MKMKTFNVYVTQRYLVVATDEQAAEQALRTEPDATKVEAVIPKETTQVHVYEHGSHGVGNLTA